MPKWGSKEYHAQKSREWYDRQPPEVLKERSLYRTFRRQEKKKEAVEFFGGKCAHCDGVYHPCVYDFHHIDHNEKESTPSKLFLLSDKRIYAELSKCIMLCANCHRLHHQDEGYASHEKRYK